jgi:hypothetical protein
MRPEASARQKDTSRIFVIALWVEMKRTPIGFHPNCKKHLKKVPRLTQNATCPHRFLRRPNDMTKRRISGVDRRVHHVLTTCPAQCSFLMERQAKCPLNKDGQFYSSTTEVRENIRG